ncbi:putative flavin-containing monooxygenase 1 [Dichanthelium oligosanthes]|uniref:Flavin-containing monooxygenase n=1 Tax=Dichanthelium oligosanthes TaxID=888268 RepID=A0A1E5UP41_9POAL|nr:putative flavin-containing monooxygenase 1 [Dichanthelium oligosanthes]
MDHKAAKRVAVVGAGTSGLAACKHLLARGFRPVVFEAGATVGGLWTRTLASTRLQSPTTGYRFSDFPWPESADAYPRHGQVVEYLAAYARRFGVEECVRFRSKVVAAEYVGGAADTAADAAGDEMWAGNGEAFGSDGAGQWRLTVRHGDSDGTETYEFDFLILCIGRFSGVPNIPSFPPGGGPDAFHGEVLHSMDFSDMDDADAAALVKGKRLAVVGSGKSAFDIAAECAEANGAERPCTMVCRSPRWLLHDLNVWGKLNLGYLYMNRFAQLMVGKPGAGLASSLLATMLTPLAWLISKVTGAYYKRAIPMREHGMEPEHGFAGCISSCKVGMLPEAFYDKVSAGSVVMRRSRSFSFCEDGLVLDGAGDGSGRVVPADLVIVATGFRGDQKLRDMFVSPRVKEMVAGSRSSDTTVPLYRECVHPRIPQMAVIGYAESLTNIYSIEMMAKWVARFLDGAFRLPGVRRMERSAAEWGGYMRRSNGESFRGSCLGAVSIWYNDQLCRDMGCEPRRKKGLLAEWFQPYGAVDYAGIE